MRRIRDGRVASSAALAFILFGASGKAATIVVENADQPGKGFNDMAPADPVGTNTKTTRGAQALAAVRRAADIWAAAIDSPVSITVSARFDGDGLPCSPTSPIRSSMTRRAEGPT
jgi:hypothetical protein